MEGSSDKKGRLRKAVNTAKEAVAKRVDVATGTEFRKDFEEFTDAVTTSVVGMHGDIKEIASRLDHLDSESQTLREFKDTVIRTIEGIHGDITAITSRVDQLEALGWLQGVYPRSGAMGDTGLVLKTGSATQTVKALKPGRVYALRMMSSNFGSLAEKASTNLDITIDGVTALGDDFDHVFGNCYSHKHGPYQAANTAWMTYHWRLFRATKDTATLTIAHDGDNEVIFNWVSVAPYYEK